METIGARWENSQSCKKEKKKRRGKAGEAGEIFVPSQGDKILALVRKWEGSTQTQQTHPTADVAAAHGKYLRDDPLTPPPSLYCPYAIMATHTPSQRYLSTRGGSYDVSDYSLIFILFPLN
jgi:hypothetical protein